MIFPYGRDGSWFIFLQENGGLRRVLMLKKETPMPCPSPLPYPIQKKLNPALPAS
jgi:hypothetical protein